MSLRASGWFAVPGLLAFLLWTQTALAFTHESFVVPAGWVDLSPGTPAANGQDPRVPPQLVQQMHAQSNLVATAFDIENAGDGFGENFNAIVAPYERSSGPIDERSLREMVTGMNQEIARTMPNSGYHVIEQAVVVLAGVYAARWVAEGTIGGILVRQLVYVVPGGEQVAIITYSTTPDQWTRYRPIFDAAALGTRGTSEPPARGFALGRIVRSGVIGGVAAAVIALLIGLGLQATRRKA